MESNLDVYWAALDRIVRGCPTKVNKNAKITNDLVSLEAGRSKGSIKRSREQFTILISAISEAAQKQRQPLNKDKQAFNNLKKASDDLRTQLELALGREVSLLQELYALKITLSALTGDKIIPIKKKNL